MWVYVILLVILKLYSVYGTLNNCIKMLNNCIRMHMLKNDDENEPYLLLCLP